LAALYLSDHLVQDHLIPVHSQLVVVPAQLVHLFLAHHCLEFLPVRPSLHPLLHNAVIGQYNCQQFILIATQNLSVVQFNKYI